VQQEYTKDVPAIPLFNRTETFAFSPELVNFAPIPGAEYYTYNAYEWEKPGSDTIVVGFTQEPASLFRVVEDAMVSALAYSLIQGMDYYSPNFTYTPILLKQLPTLENGLATMTAVEVKEGDKVQGADGNIAPLAAGMSVINSDGETVEFTGGTVMMNQMTMTYEYVDGLTWSDGVPVTAADFELGWKIQCDPESGATSFITCDKVSDVTFADNGNTATFVPGVSDPLYYLSQVGWQFPAHQVIESDGPYKGMTLAEVPAKDWATLPEIAEKPLGFGPYVITEWVKGEKMVFEANPYFALGEAKTKNLVISFITAENAEAQLLGGQVDVLDSTTLAGVTQTLADAAAAGTVTVLVNPGATWEHIDFSLFVK
jgi:ABC-type transport system substrate-binding protein